MRRWTLLLAVLGIPACSNDPTVGEPDPRFALRSPANGAIGVSGVVVFAWDTSFGSDTYKLQISTDPGFATLLVDQGGITATSVTPSVTLAEGTVYYWQVIAQRASGDVLADGSPFSFTTAAAVPGSFMLSTPANLSVGVSTTPTFTWTSSLGAISYRLQLATDAGFGTIVAEQAAVTSTSTTITSPLSANTVYFWRVQAESSSTTTASNAPFSFTTLQPGPGSFTMTAPANGATAVPSLPTFIWTASTGATSYRLEVATDSAFASKVIDQSGIATTSFTPTVSLLQGRQHFWRVTASGPAGNTPASGAPFTFTTL